MSYEIMQKSALKNNQFPFDKMRPDTEDCIFVPDAQAGRGGYKIRRYAKERGYKVKMRRRVHNQEHGFFVWVRKPAVKSFGKVAAPQPDAVSVSAAL